MNAEEVARILEDHGSFAVLSHEDPDGDSVGSQLALCSALKRLGKRSWAVSADPVPTIYGFLEGAVRVEVPSVAEDAEIVVVVDSSNERRVSGLESFKARGVDILNIDHHRSNTRFGRWNFVDPDASACAEQVYDVLGRMGVSLNAEEAAGLYVGILTDTGAFRFPNTTARCLRISAKLVECGFSAAEVARSVFWEKTPESTWLLGLALSSLDVCHDGQIAVMVVTRQMSRKARASASDSDGFASYTKVISGIKVGLLFRELDVGGVRVSLRSDSGVDVERVARLFGGGGHPTSAGCVVKDSLADAKRRVIGEVVRLLDHRREKPIREHERDPRR